jgi:hypothetical protein
LDAMDAPTPSKSTVAASVDRQEALTHVLVS